MTTTSFDDFIREIEEDAKAEGPGAVRELELLRAYYRGVGDTLGGLIAERRKVERLRARIAKLEGKKR